MKNKLILVIIGLVFLTINLNAIEEINKGLFNKEVIKEILIPFLKVLVLLEIHS